MSDTKVSIDLELVTTAFKDALKDVTNKTDSFATSAKTSFGSIGTAFNVMAGNLAANAVAKALGFISDSIGRVMAESIAAEEASNNLKTALKNAGDGASDSSDQLSAYATQLSNVTTFDDDLIVKQEALLVSLTSLNNDGIKQAVTAAANLAGVLGIDLNQATDLIAKSINGKATVEMKNLGVVVNKNSTDSQNLANIVKVLGDSNSAAADKTNTYSGALLQQDNAYGNLLQAVGDMITQNPTVIQGIKDITKAFVDSTTFIITNKDAIIEFGKQAIIFGGIAGTLTTALWLVTGGFTAIGVAATVAWTAISGPIGLAVVAIGLVTTAIYSLYDSFKAIIGNIEKHNNELNNMTNITSTVTTANNKFVDSLLAGTGASASENAALITNNETKKEAARHTDALTEAQKQLLASNLAYIEGLAKSNDDIAAVYTNRLDMLKLQYENENIVNADSDAINYQAKIDRETTYFQARAALLNEQQLKDTARINASSATYKEKMDAKQALDKGYATKFLADENTFQGDLAKLRADQAKQEATARAEKIKADDAANTYKLQSTVSLLGSMATALSGASKANFETSKNLMLAQATIAGYLAVQQALASGPPPWNFIAAAAVGIQTGINISNINKQKPPAFANGGIVPGNSFSGDRITSRLNSGEMVLNKGQQAKLFSMANNGSGSSSKVEALLGQLINTIQNQSQSISIDGREIVNVVRNGLASGRTI